MAGHRLDWDEYFSHGFELGRAGAEEETQEEFFEKVPVAKQSFTDQLVSQLRIVTDDEKTISIGDYIIGSLDESGYLATERESIRHERKRMEGAMTAMKGLTAFRSDANFILFRTERSSAEVFEALKAGGVLVRDLGSTGPLRNCLRVTVGTEEENGLFLGLLASACR